MSRPSIDPAYIAIDWGTTNRRIYVLDPHGNLLRSERDNCGAVAMSGRDWVAEMADIRNRFGDLPALLAGMAGSTRGWTPAPYLPAPLGITDLVERLVWAEPERTAIIPGVRSPISTVPDVMRGEEVQFLGAVISGAVPQDATLVQPGTHCKWAKLAQGQIVAFRTAMTGEVFAALKGSTLLGDFMGGKVKDGPAFRAGLALAPQALLRALFTERARVLIGEGNADEVAARVSGLLIGQDVASAELMPAEKVYMIDDGSLGELYIAAISAAGGAGVIVNGKVSFLTGMHAIWERAHGFAH